jgi:hypothetical protein
MFYLGYEPCSITVRGTHPWYNPKENNINLYHHSNLTTTFGVDDKRLHIDVPNDTTASCVAWLLWLSPRYVRAELELHAFVTSALDRHVLQSICPRKAPLVPNGQEAA